MGMRLIEDCSPTCCGEIGTDSAPFQGRIHDSQTFHSVLSAGDGDRDRMGKQGPAPADPGDVGDLSPRCPWQSRVCPRRGVE